jgi:hypothetical protein
MNLHCLPFGLILSHCACFSAQRRLCSTGSSPAKALRVPSAGRSPTAGGAPKESSGPPARPLSSSLPMPAKSASALMNEGPLRMRRAPLVPAGAVTPVGAHANQMRGSQGGSALGLPSSLSSVKSGGTHAVFCTWNVSEARQGKGATGNGIECCRHGKAFRGEGWVHC